MIKQGGKKPEEYRCVAVSTAHLTAAAKDCLSLEVASNMVMDRDTGWFVKLYDDWPSNAWTDEPHLLVILFWAWNNNYRLIEFDADALELDQFVTFEE
jgi:hypothetical protein